MKDLFNGKLSYNSRKPEDFSQIPIFPKRYVVQNAELYLPDNSLILGAMYAPIGCLCDDNGKILQEYNRGQLERLLQSIREGVRDEIPKLLEDKGEPAHLQQFVTQIIVGPQFPKRGRKVIYGVEFLNR